MVLGLCQRVSTGQLSMASTAEFRNISKAVALVTGAASGLGRATAVRLASLVSVRLPEVETLTSPIVDHGVRT